MVYKHSRALKKYERCENTTMLKSKTESGDNAVCMFDLPFRSSVLEVGHRVQKHSTI